MAKQYKWKADTTFKSYTSPLSHGVVPTGYENWQSADPGTTSSTTWQYWYRDANVPVGGQWLDANSSRVVVSLTESWTATIDNKNNLIVTLSTTINSIVRDDCQGTNTDTPGRIINIYREESGTAILSLTDNQVATAHTIYAGPLVLDSYTFTLAPGASLERSSLYLHNYSEGYADYDDIWFGVQFKNDLPAETVPHAVWGGSSQWLSHNRDGGDLRIWAGTRWTDNLANIDGGTGFGDPPSIYHDSKYYNARTFGLGA